MRKDTNKINELGGIFLIIIGLLGSYPILYKLYFYVTTGKIEYFYTTVGSFLLRKGVYFTGIEALLMNLAVFLIGVVLVVCGARILQNALK